jgi:hypothetical protein
MNTDRHGYGGAIASRSNGGMPRRAVASLRVFLLLFLLLAIPAFVHAQERDTNGQIRLVVQPIPWPADNMLTPKAREILREERKVFAEELRHLHEWIPDNMRGAISKMWTRAGKTMISESHAIEYVPPMSAEQVEKIIAEMEAGAQDTVLDNIERFRIAMAKRVPVFAKGYEQFKNREYGKASITIHEPLTKEKVLHAFHLYHYDTLPPFIYCVTTFMEGECFSLDGALHEAMVRYWIVKGKMPACLSLSATARRRLADMYERTGREHFAIPFYQKLALTYVDCLSDTALLALHVRARELMADNPFRGAVEDLQSIARHLDRGQSGAAVQAAQARLLAALPKLATDYEGDGRGNLQINWEMMGGDIQRAGLQEGGAPTKLGFKKEVAVVGSDDWAKLKPRQKQEVIQKFYENYPPEYRDMIEEYFRSMSREGSNE